MQAENTAGTSISKLLSRKLAIWKKETAYLHLVQVENGRKLIESADVLVVGFEYVEMLLVNFLPAGSCKMRSNEAYEIKRLQI